MEGDDLEPSKSALVESGQDSRAVEYLVPMRCSAHAVVHLLVRNLQLLLRQRLLPWVRRCPPTQLRRARCKRIPAPGPLWDLAPRDGGSAGIFTSPSDVTIRQLTEADYYTSAEGGRGRARVAHREDRVEVLLRPQEALRHERACRRAEPRTAQPLNGQPKCREEQGSRR